MIPARQLSSMCDSSELGWSSRVSTCKLSSLKPKLLYRIAKCWLLRGQAQVTGHIKPLLANVPLAKARHMTSTEALWEQQTRAGTPGGVVPWRPPM